MRLENLEERSLLSAVSPFVGVLPEQNVAPVIESTFASIDSSIPDVSSAIPEGYTLVVTTFEDVVDDSDGELSLREAIAEAWYNDTIVFAKPGTIKLSGSQLTIDNTITIDATSVWDAENDVPGITIDGDAKSCVLLVTNGAHLSLKGVKIINGKGVNGGGVSVSGNAVGSATISNCVISENTSSCGGGIYAEGNVSITDCDISCNSAINGGGVYIGGVVTITNSTISGNTAVQSYGDNGHYCGNGEGGGCFVTSIGTLTIDNCLITNNKADTGGGVFGRYVVNIKNCNISGNTASYGGGVYGIGDIHGGKRAEITITNCSISDNTANNGGGIYGFNFKKLTITNSVISDNTASSYGGICVDSYGLSQAGASKLPNVLITNSTIAGNAATYNISSSCGGIEVRYGALIKLYNTIIAYNSGSDLKGVTFSGGNVLTTDVSRMEGEDIFEYNPNLPLFVDARNRDYRLSKHSQAINCGNNSYAVAAGLDETSTDIIGEPRFIGDSIDIGAYEYVVYPPAAPTDLEFGVFDASTRSVPVFWKDNSSDELEFVVQYSDDDANWKTLYVAADTTTATLSDLELGKRYTVRVCARNEIGDSAYISRVYTTPNVPNAPSDLTIGSFNPSTRSVSVTWEDNSSDETGFLVQYSIDDENWTTVSVAANKTIAKLSDLKIGAAYTVRVAARNDIGDSPFVSDIFTTPNVPKAPSNLTIGSFNMATRSVSVYWKDNSSDETGFIVQYSIDGANWKSVVTMANKKSATLSDLEFGATYTVRVAATNKIGNSSFVSDVFTTPVPSADVRVSNVETLSNSAIVVGGALSVDGIVVTNEGDVASEAVSLSFYATVSGTIDEESILMKTLACGKLEQGSAVVVSSGALSTTDLISGQTYHVVWRVDCSNDVNAENKLGSASERVTVYRESDDVDVVSFDRESYSTRQGDAFWLETWLSSAAPGPQTYSFWFDFGDGSFVERANRGVVSSTEFSNMPGERAISVKVVNLATKSVVATGSRPFAVFGATPSFYVAAESAFDGDAVILDVEAIFPVPASVSRWSFDWGDGEKSEFDRLGLSLCVSHCYAANHKERSITLDVELEGGETYSVSFDTRLLR
ncbi:MAG: fibronectin type III domain-containing protein [Thermoguttaceae bacterium]|nr:fibronectin type III domain-containing protein [Thermoguttaceae bacterium]